MSTGDLLDIKPHDLQFSLELKKQISRSLHLLNKTDNYVAFKVKTTNPNKYHVRPNTGVVMPRSTCHVIVTMQAQKEMPLDLQCKDKFLLQSVIVSPGATAKDVTAKMFNKELGHRVEECKLRVLYVSPPQRPSPAREGSKKSSSPGASVSDNRNSTTAYEFTPVSRSYNGQLDSKDNSSKARAILLRLAEEKLSVIEQNNRLQQEMEVLRREGHRSRGGIPMIYVVLIGLICIVLGYSLKT